MRSGFVIFTFVQTIMNCPKQKLRVNMDPSYWTKRNPYQKKTLKKERYEIFLKNFII